MGASGFSAGQGPIQTPAVRGCDGSASRAHRNTFFKSIAAFSGLSLSSVSGYDDSFRLSGSLKTSHA